MDMSLLSFFMTHSVVLAVVDVNVDCTDNTINVNVGDVLVLHCES